MTSLSGEIAADTSFYVCFLDDIKKEEELGKILNKFKFHLPKKVYEEISKSARWGNISAHKNLNIFKNEELDIGKALYPFFSKDQIEKGESEIIVLAFIYAQISSGDFYFILDDGVPRSFIENNCKSLLPFLSGTVGFLNKCYIKYEIFDKLEYLDILESIKNSKFRIKKEIIDKFICEANLKNE